MITYKEGITNRWVVYFEELLKENGEEGNIPRTSENNGYLTVQLWVEDYCRGGRSRNSKIKK
jgi:hypothetical protein